jgi:hypothetical protein
VSGALTHPTPFVTVLRTPRGAVTQAGAPGGERVTVRLQFEALWDAMAVSVRTDEPVITLVDAILTHVGLQHASQADFVTKLRGWEVKSTEVSVAEAGARDGSTFLVAYRFRRPIR